LISDRIKNREAKVAVIGLGYVGLPLALEMAKSASVIGFDINAERIELMKKGVDPSKELPSEFFNDVDITFTSELEELEKSSFYIVAVPTPINEQKLPDLSALLAASKTVGKVIKKGDYVVFESTVYPGCTEEDCVPIIENESGLKMGVDFSVGYSPERTNPGDKINTIRTIKKIVSANSSEALEEVANVYSMVVDAGIHKAPSIKVAEAGKIVENVQRDINIALVNELSIMFNKMGVNTFDVLEAAGTKWNFHNYKPGLVGGHCIGVDPYYLTHKAASLGYHAKVVNSGRYVNDSMGFYVGKQTVKKMVAQGKNILESKVLILGATFKENVSDVRNSKVADVYKELISFGVNVDVADPFADSVALEKEYGITLTEFENKKYDAIILAVNHAPYMNFTKSDMKNMLNEPGLLIDVKGVYKDAGFDVPYWSL
tara:strand:- start:206390 stop:207682 length:1293 start_codon:yes stop_codon:yes gene_type:complete